LEDYRNALHTLSASTSRPIRDPTRHAREPFGASPVRLGGRHDGRDERPVETVVIRSEGDDTRMPLDSFPRPGAFVAALRDALLENRVDVVVHSYKDLPSGPTEGLTVAAVPVRAGVRDVLVTQGGVSLTELRAGAAVGTSSPRRSAALLRVRPGPSARRHPRQRGHPAQVRVRRGLDAVVLAEAGLQRLGLLTVDMCLLDPDLMLPAPAQGALATSAALTIPSSTTSHASTTARRSSASPAERAVLDEVGAACNDGCGSARVHRGRVADADGRPHRAPWRRLCPAL